MTLEGGALHDHAARTPAGLRSEGLGSVSPRPKQAPARGGLAALIPAAICKFNPESQMSPNDSDAVKAAIFDALKASISSQIEDGNYLLTWGLQVHELLNQPHRFQEAYDALEDDLSRRVFLWCIQYRIAGYLFQGREKAEELYPPVIGRAEWRRMAKKGSALPEASLEGHLDIDLVENFVIDGYRLPGVCEVEAGDTVIDLGAFNGNSSIVLSRHAGPSGKVLAFEPNPLTREMLARNLAAVDASNVEVIPAGVSDTPGELGFVQDGAASRFDPTGDVRVPVVTIDNLVAERNIERLDFLKLDIEGYEMPALRGAGRTIYEHRPKIAVAVYHLHRDLYEIQAFIKRLSPWYKFYLRHNYTIDAEIVLFCAPIGRA
jgi:FkbM family methyltransferase